MSSSQPRLALAAPNIPEFVGRKEGEKKRVVDAPIDGRERQADATMKLGVSWAQHALQREQRPEGEWARPV